VSNVYRNDNMCMCVCAASVSEIVRWRCWSRMEENADFN